MCFVALGFYLCNIPLIGQDCQKTTNAINVTINSIDIEAQFFNSSTVKILKAPQNWKYTKESLSVTANPQT